MNYLAQIKGLEEEWAQLLADKMALQAELDEYKIKFEQLQADLKELREKTHFYMLQVRDIATPCKRCGGYGVKSYGDTSTWHHGIGGQAITSGVCDGCWGSGDADNKWLDLRTLRGNKQLRTENEQQEGVIESLRWDIDNYLKGTLEAKLLAERDLLRGGHVAIMKEINDNPALHNDPAISGLHTISEQALKPKELTNEG